MRKIDNRRNSKRSSVVEIDQDLIKLPDYGSFLFEPIRYKVLFGGRGSSKSWTAARALLLCGVMAPLRVLCTREVQKSLKQSVHKLLSDQIQGMGLGSYYRVQDEIIRGVNGTEITFSGLSDQTAESIKSFESIDICWVEEAQNVSKRSWDILIPTIRKDESEIWITFNPHLDTDDTYVKFITNPPKNCESRLVNWNNNPWWNDVLEQERLHCQLTSPDDYDMIWEGKCRATVEGAIYSRELEDAIHDGRVVNNLPYDPRLKVHTVWDLGFNDENVILLVQVLRSEIRIIKEIVDNKRGVDTYVSELSQMRYNWGYDFLPHDAYYSDIKSGGKTVNSILTNMGRKTQAVPRVGREEGIRQTRTMFSRFIISRTSCPETLEAMKRYRRVMNDKTGQAGNPLHDKHSNPADAIRYLSLSAHMMKNDEDDLYQPIPQRSETVPGMGY